MKPSEQISAQIAHLNSSEEHSCESMADHASIITLKPAIRYQFKTGQRDWPKT